MDPTDPKQTGDTRDLNVGLVEAVLGHALARGFLLYSYRFEPRLDHNGRTVVRIECTLMEARLANPPLPED